MSCNTSAVKALADDWLRFDSPANESHRQVSDLVAAGNWPELEKMMTPALTFGTAGLRAEMGAGFARMNSLTVLQATQGVALYLKTTVVDAQERGVVVGYDHRHGSAQFARVTAMVLLHSGIRVHLHPHVVHTPMVPFAIKHLRAAAGIMITASHNPKQDNGYKLYWDNFCQVISPHDKEIQRLITANRQPWTWNVEAIVSDKQPLLSTLDSSVEDAYFAAIGATLPLSPRTVGTSQLKTVYTAMHGVGWPYAQRVLSLFTVPDATPVAEQVEPDADFPTVRYPNPEEGAVALQLAIQTAYQIGANVIFANDPDADRLAVAERQQQGDETSWRVYTGNEIGTVLAAYSWQHRKTRSGNDKFAMLASAVSSKLLKRMAKVEGFRFEETMTGFKWLGNKALELQATGYTVLMAFEEAIGYMMGDIVPDKDGISALGVVAELTHSLYSQNLTIASYLDQQYVKYGYHCSHNSYFVCRQPELIKRIFTAIRTGSDDDNKGTSVSRRVWNQMNPQLSNYPTSVGGLIDIVAVRDLTTNFDSQNPPEFTALLPTSASSQMITFYLRQILDGGDSSASEPMTATLTLRTSGTEPKIKFYSEGTGDLARRTDVETFLRSAVDTMVKVLLRPDTHGLEPRQE